MNGFTKTLPKRHPLSTEVRELLGAEGFTYLTDLLDLAQDIGEYELTHKIVARECSINAQKVKRIFDILERIFYESCKFLELSSNKVTTLTTQNPIKTVKTDENQKNGHIYNNNLLNNSICLGSEEGEVTPPKPKKKIASIVPADWTPKPGFENWLKEKHPDATPDIFQTELEKFRDYSAAKGSTYKDFDAALRNWFNTGYWKQNVRRFPVQAAGIPQPGQISQSEYSQAFIKFSWDEKWAEIMKHDVVKDPRFLNGTPRLDTKDITFNGENYCYNNIVLVPDGMYPVVSTRKKEVSNA
jgi:hypothetical protein